MSYALWDKCIILIVCVCVFPFRAHDHFWGFHNGNMKEGLEGEGMLDHNSQIFFSVCTCPLCIVDSTSSCFLICIQAQMTRSHYSTINLTCLITPFSKHILKGGFLWLLNETKMHLVRPSFPKQCIKLKNNTQEPEYAEFQKQILIIWQIEF